MRHHEEQQDPAGDLTTDSNLPALFRSLDEAAVENQRRFWRRYACGLAFLVVAAGFSAAASVAHGDAEGILLGLAAASFLVTVFAEFLNTQSEAEDRWSNLRALAELVKERSWRYAVGGDPYPTDVPDVDSRFSDDLELVLEEARKWGVPPAREGYQITGAMRDLRARSLEERQDAYLRGRLQDQQHYYMEKANPAGSFRSSLAKKGNLWTSAVLGLGLLGIFVGLGAILGGWVDLMPMVAAAAASATAWSKAKQYTATARRYGPTSHALANVRRGAECTSPEDQWCRLVDRAEDAMAREHIQWSAAMGVDVTGIKPHWPD